MLGRLQCFCHCARVAVTFHRVVTIHCCMRVVKTPCAARCDCAFQSCHALCTFHPFPRRFAVARSAEFLFGGITSQTRSNRQPLFKRFKTVSLLAGYEEQGRTTLQFGFGGLLAFDLRLLIALLKVSEKSVISWYLLVFLPCHRITQEQVTPTVLLQSNGLQWLTNS